MINFLWEAAAVQRPSFDGEYLVMPVRIAEKMMIAVSFLNWVCLTNHEKFESYT